MLNKKNFISACLDFLIYFISLCCCAEEEEENIAYLYES